MEYAPVAEEMRALAQAHKARAASRRGLRLRSEGMIVPVISFDRQGALVPLEEARRLRGFVELLQGERRIARVLVVAGRLIDGALRLEFKLYMPERDAPPADHVAPRDGPAGLLPRI